MKSTLRVVRKSFILALSLLGALALLIVVSSARYLPANAQAEPAAIHGTTIIVDTVADLDPASITKTCNFTQFTFVAAADGCTLRRAILEASAVPQAQRPVTISFNLPPGDAVDGVWTLPISNQLRLFTSNDTNGTNNNGAVTIDGSLQPGGRADGPKIMLDTNDVSLIVESERNVIRNLAFKGGGTLQFGVGADGNVVTGIWMGLTNNGQEIHFRTPGNQNRMAGGGIFIRSDDNVIEGNTISGAFAKAIDIDGGDNNLIQNNQIGTRADGTVPDVPPAVQCVPDFDPSGWYGGWGIALSGSNNQILDNRIAGLQNVRSTNDTIPMAIEIFGTGHTISGNIIGVDSAGKEVGVCGQGIKASSTDTTVIDNQIIGSRTSFEDDVLTAIMGSGPPSSFNRVTVRGNIVKDGPGNVYEFGGTGVPAALRTFAPAKVTSINGATIQGTAGDSSPCPTCTIDLYADDLDDIGEALSYLGSATADSNGNWNITLGSALGANLGIRTSSTLPTSGIVNGFGAGTTTKVSKLYYGLHDLTITGPISGVVGATYLYTITATPVTATVPISYSAQATDNPLQTTGQVQNHVISFPFTWDTPGTKTISATAANDLSVALGSFEVEIIEPAVPMTGVSVVGPTMGEVGQRYQFTITVVPNQATGPFNYTVNSTDHDPLTSDNNDSPSVIATLTWVTPGVKTIAVVVETEQGEVQNTFNITIAAPTQSGASLFMPKLRR